MPGLALGPCCGCDDCPEPGPTLTLEEWRPNDDGSGYYSWHPSDLDYDPVLDAWTGTNDYPLVGRWSDSADCSVPPSCSFSTRMRRGHVALKRASAGKTYWLQTGGFFCEPIVIGPTGGYDPCPGDGGTRDTLKLLDATQEPAGYPWRNVGLYQALANNYPGPDPWHAGYLFGLDLYQGRCATPPDHYVAVVLSGGSPIFRASNR